MKWIDIKKTFVTLGIACTGGLASIGAYKALDLDSKDVVFPQPYNDRNKIEFKQTGITSNTIPADFTVAAARSTPAVVHIRSTSKGRRGGNMSQVPDAFRDFFGDDFFSPQERGGQPSVGSGSGVILTADGYIVTNNHVVEDAEEIEVMLHDNRSYAAKVIGTDPSTDLAVIRIEEKNLPAMPMGNSDEVKVGEWVLAVGNPFNLSSTVTAGIVSAKGRNISLLKDKDNAAIESFIQTDAAINPGNSGGALVNTNGNLVGINTAIATPTGTYAGYAFAVPVNIVKKVTEDLIKHGVVQRALLNIMIRDVNAQLAREKELNLNDGVYVDSVLASGSAAEAGVKSGDVIIKVDDTKIHSVGQLQETIARRRPGDVVNVTVVRGGQERLLKVTLKNKGGKTDVVKREEKGVMQQLGIEVETVPAKDLPKLKIDGGVKVKKINSGKIRSATDMREGFIITKLDRKPVTSVSDLNDLLKDRTGGVMIEGVYPDAPGVYYYAFGL